MACKMLLLLAHWDHLHSTQASMWDWGRFDL